MYNKNRKPKNNKNNIYALISNEVTNIISRIKNYNTNGVHILNPSTRNLVRPKWNSFNSVDFIPMGFSVEFDTT